MPSITRQDQSIDGWLTQDELRSRWKVSKQTVRRLRQSGKLPSFEITRSLYRFRLEDILRIESEGIMLPALGGKHRPKTRKKLAA